MTSGAGGVPAGPMWRIGNGLMGALFVVAAAMQYNDPDPVRWIAIYAGAGLVSVLVAVRRSNLRTPAVLVGVAALIWAGVIATAGPGLITYLHMFDAWEMRSEPVEQAREASGLLIVAARMAIIVARSRRAR